ncbi:MAG: Ig-like domain repeat protein, partial [Acidimicrobiales bacterium]
MNTRNRRTALRAVAATALGTALVISTVLVSGLFATGASASTTPPWEPIGNPPQAGGLTFYNSSGQVITSGNITDDPIAAYIQGNTALQPAPTLVDLNGYDPTTSGAPVTAPGNWSGVGLGSSNFPSSAPGALGTSTLPVYTGQNISLTQLTETLPNTDTSTTDGYAGIYVLRLFTFQHNDGGTTTSYDSADISVDPNTGAWTLVYSPQAATTTTLEAPTPAGPQNAGTPVTLTADIADASAPGSVQFESDGSPVGSPQPVTNGTATLTTSALPSGTDSLTAIYTPTTGAAFTGSTSTNPVSYVINAPTVPGAPTGVSAAPANGSASVSFTAPASNGGSAITSYTVTATDTTNSGNGGQTASGSASPINVTGLTNGDSYTFTVKATNGVGAGPASAASNAVTPAAGPLPPTAPNGATSSQGASSASPSGTATAGVSGITATGTGEGALTVATYLGDPVVGAVSGGTGVYYDVALSSNSAFGSLTITISNLGPGGQSIDWWNGSAWVPFSDQTFNAATDSVTITVNSTTSPTLAELTGTQIAVSSNPAPSLGYWEVASDGGIFAFGAAGFYGSEGGKSLNKPIVGIAGTPDGHGYWEVASDGGVFSFGDAKFYGSEGGKTLNKPIVGIAATPSGNGYWEVASDGGIFSFGDATFYGSEGGKTLNKPIVGIVATHSGHGYWEVASDGGIFSFGDAKFYGSEGGKTLNKPIVGIAATPSGNGYWEVASDGGVFAFGDAGFFGSQGGKPLNQP